MAEATSSLKACYGRPKKLKPQFTLYQPTLQKMFGTTSEETEVKVSASKAWDLFGTLELVKVVTGKFVEAIDVVEGDGGTDTILKLTMKSSMYYYLKISITSKLKHIISVCLV